MGAISFGKPLTKEVGDIPSIAINRQSIVVSVHVESGSVFYRVGEADKKNKTLSLGDSIPLGFNGRATIALNNSNLAVCVYDDQEKAIHSIAGFVDTSTGRIKFGPSERYDSGVVPSVALRDDGGALEVHESQRSKGGLYCHAGPFTSGNINWGGSSGGDNGEAPKAALVGDVACEVHRSQNSPSNLYYNVGTVDIRNRSCRLSGGTQYYDTKSRGASSPSVALTSGLIAIEVHDVGGGDGPLAYFFGTVDPGRKRIGWPDNPTDIGEFGQTPSVAANDDGVAVVAYTRSGRLTYLVGTF